jgi:anthranilate synthase/aminodeoxychorismate synthase-like glutamine amidotransferase
MGYDNTMILMLDNYDSFVHNLARYLRRLGQPTTVIRSDAIDAAGCMSLKPSAIVVSPGPKRPEEAGCSVEVIQKLGATIPILGVCLGHQAIGIAMGASVVRCQGMHGRSSEIEHDGEAIFAGCRPRMRVGRYHSLAIDPSTLPPELIVTATTEGTHADRVIMGIKHRSLPIYGLQFHPESVLTEDGADLLSNFLKLALRWRDDSRMPRVAS